MVRHTRLVNRCRRAQVTNRQLPQVKSSVFACISLWGQEHSSRPIKYRNKEAFRGSANTYTNDYGIVGDSNRETKAWTEFHEISRDSLIRLFVAHALWATALPSSRLGHPVRLRFHKRFRNWTRTEEKNQSQPMLCAYLLQLWECICELFGVWKSSWRRRERKKIVVALRFLFVWALFADKIRHYTWRTRTHTHME